MHTILLVDAELVQRNLLCSILKEKLTYKVIDVSSGGEAIDYVMNETLPKPDLIVFDITLIENAYETIASLKVLTSNIPIITLVKYGDYDSAMATLSAGAQDFLHKPVAMERLDITLRNMLLLRDARRETEWLRRDRITNNPADMLESKINTLPVMLVGDDGNIRRMEQLEAEVIRFAMQFYGGRMTEVARRLGIGRSTLYRKINDLDITSDASEAA
jgi:DNA-binding NtrC family response regulator